jgi:TetR/AcrR family transcriptional repressor of mexJK operon
MSAITVRKRKASRRAASGPRADDPRVMRTRTAVVDAARALFLEKGYAGTTMDDIAERAGLTKRTVYNNYGDKAALFTQIVTEVIAFADEFARGLREWFAAGIPKSEVAERLEALGARMATSIVREEVVSLRRLLIGEAREFQALATMYFERAPGQVLRTLATGFAGLAREGSLRVEDAPTAAAQFAYLAVGAPLDRAMLAGTVPTRARLTAAAHEGVRTFLARYGTGRPGVRAPRAPTAARAPRRVR